jgi:hypothetical protein
MEGSGFRARLRAGRSLQLLDRVADDVLGADVHWTWGNGDVQGGGPRSFDRTRDVDAERDLIRTAVQRAHQRRARRRPVVSRTR